jgi:uncharacterized protein HemY
MSDIGRLLIILGIVILIVGLIVTFLPSLRLGRLPGDIVIRRGNWSVYIPIVTSILISLILTLLLWFFGSFRR